MKYLILLFLGAGIVLSQSATSSAVILVSSDPTGVACVTNTSKARLYHSILYTCQSNAFAVVASGGAPTGAAAGDLSGTYPNPGVAKINGTALSGLATGVLKNTTTTGVPSIAVAADITPLLAAFTGDCTTSAGATAIICTKTSGVAFAASATTDTTNATNITTGTLPAGILPNPSASTLGGVQSKAAVGSNFLTSISTAGVPSAAQPAFTDISGTATGTQLPNPSASTLGGVQSKAAVTSNFLTAISTSGVPAAAQPAFTDLSGAATVAQGGTGITTAVMPYPTSLSSPPLLATANTDSWNNTIVGSSVDANGNPNFLGTAANTVLPINGGTTSLVMQIGGYVQVLSSNVTLTVPSTATVQQWILAKRDIANASMVAGDFLAMNTAPQYSYTAPTCPSPSPALSATNPAFWFDLSTNLSKLCTSNGSTYAASPSIVIGVVDVNATPAVDFAVAEPYRLNPFKRYEMFGNGSDATLTVTSGTTTLDAPKQYASFAVLAGTVNHTAWNTTGATSGVYIHSQNPVMVIGGTITASGLSRTGGSGGTGTGASGTSVGLGGAGAGGGGSGTTSAAGGGGGSRTYWSNLGNGAGGTAGTITPGVGGAGIAASNMPLLTSFVFSCMGSGGGAGGGDGTNAGGGGGTGGGGIFIWAPAIYVATGISVVANGNNGSNAAGGNAGGGGGGGGGCLVLNGGYVSTTGATITANGGSAGTKLGTGQNGGIGGAGIAQQNRLW